MSAKIVIYLSSCALDSQGVPDPFMLQELPWLQSHFDRVWLVSYYGVAELTGAKAERGLRIAPHGSHRVVWGARLRAPFLRELWQEWAHMRRDGVFSPRNFLKLLLFAIRGQKLHGWLEELLDDVNPEQTTLYACWMSYEAYAAALSKRKHESLHLIARGHAFDIDRGRNAMNPYLMKRLIAGYADGLFFISEYAKSQYLAYMQGMVNADKLHVVPMGSGGRLPENCKEPPLFAGGKWHVVSCATISEIKQLPVLIDALSLWDGAPLDWLHIGGGAEEEAVRAYAAEKLENSAYIRYRITGRLTNDEVQQIYFGQPFDVFINTSRMEGVPVSMMEAMRFGIPIIAPRVGGIPELVDGQTGILYEPEDGAQGALGAMRAFAALSKERVLEMRDCAQRRWNEGFRSDILLPLLFAEDAKRREEAEAPGEEGARGHD